VGEFGDKFRKAREKKELSLDDVSNVTKIGARMLQAIEEEHFDQLPGGVFNKGFIRAYSKHLGLNDEEAVTDYLACLRQAQIDAHEVWQPEPSRTGPPRPRPATPEKRHLVESTPPSPKSQPPVQVEELPELQLPRAEDVRPGRKNFSEKSTYEIPWRILAVSALVLVLAIILWTRHTRATNTASASTSPARTATDAPAPVSVSTPTPTIQPSNAAAARSTTTSTQPPVPNSQPTATHSATTGPATLPAPDASDNDNNDVTIRTSPKAAAKPSEKPAASLTLVIRATETSWISVLADGQTVSQETLIAPAHTSIRATHEIVARIGNAAGVTFLWNGQEIPAAGAEAEVKTFVFDSTGMRVVPSTPPPAQN
jgi:cytoskeletal protein RodZ